MKRNGRNEKGAALGMRGRASRSFLRTRRRAQPPGTVTVPVRGVVRGRVEAFMGVGWRQLPGRSIPGPLPVPPKGINAWPAGARA